jgi:hypothetical protein
MRNPIDIIHNGKTAAEILRLHQMLLASEIGGERAYLSGAYLTSADLRDADLRSADLRGATLVETNLADADLTSADLRGVNLRGVNLTSAYLRDADLTSADLRGANLDATAGNMREIKSAQFDTWPITWTTAPNGTVRLQIGCQSHDLALWEKSDPRWIDAMDAKASDWWAKYRDVVLALVKASPASPWTEKEADNA